MHRCGGRDRSAKRGKSCLVARWRRYISRSIVRCTIPVCIWYFLFMVIFCLYTYFTDCKYECLALTFSVLGNMAAILCLRLAIPKSIWSYMAVKSATSLSYIYPTKWIGHPVDPKICFAESSWSYRCTTNPGRTALVIPSVSSGSFTQPCWRCHAMERTRMYTCTYAQGNRLSYFQTLNW